MITLVCAVLSGAMFYLSLGLDDVWSLAWIAPLPLLWLAYGPAPRWQLFAASLAAYAAGQIYLLQCYWGMLPWFAIALMTLGFGMIFATTMVGARAAWRHLPAWAALFAFPAIWTALEYLVGLVSPHGSWSAMGYSQVAFPPAIQVASLFGLYAVTFLLCLFASALAVASARLRYRRSGSASRSGTASRGIRPPRSWRPTLARRS